MKCIGAASIRGVTSSLPLRTGAVTCYYTEMVTLRERAGPNIVIITSDHLVIVSCCVFLLFDSCVCVTCTFDSISIICMLTKELLFGWFVFH